MTTVPTFQTAAIPQVILGNHAAVIVPAAQREQIRQFYCGILGATITRSTDQKDDICLGGNFYIAFMYGDADESAFLRTGKSIWLEIKSDRVEELRQKIVAFGVRTLNIPDPHLYFQAPGGQVLRLVGLDEDLAHYEGRAQGPDVARVKQAITSEPA